MILFVKLFLAHLLGDFFLQTKSWVQAKELKKLKSGFLYLHALIHTALILLVVWDASFVKWALLLAGIHFILDGIKLQLQREETKRTWFFIDQTAHLITLIAFSLWYQWEQISWPTVDQKTWIARAPAGFCFCGNQPLGRSWVPGRRQVDFSIW